MADFCSMPYDLTKGSGALAHMIDASEKAATREPRPLHLLEPHVARGIVRRLRLTALLGRFNDRHVWAAFMFINGFITIATLALLAMVNPHPVHIPVARTHGLLILLRSNLTNREPAQHDIWPCSRD